MNAINMSRERKKERKRRRCGKAGKIDRDAVGKNKSVSIFIELLDFVFLALHLAHFFFSCSSRLLGRGSTYVSPACARIVHGASGALSA
jgi:hypothetical protein